MYLIFTHAEDPCGEALMKELSRRLDAVYALRAEDILLSQSCRVRLPSGGSLVSELRLADGREISSSDVKGVVNRMLFPASHTFSHCPSSEREYIQQEVWAFAVSFLSAFHRPVFNPATPTGLSGTVPSPLRLAHHARAVGLVPEGDKFSNETHDGPVRMNARNSGCAIVRVLVVGRFWLPHAGASLPPTTGQACVQLARLLETPLVAFLFHADDRGELLLMTAELVPDLRHFGDDGFDLLAHQLSQITDTEECHDPALWNSHRNPTAARGRCPDASRDGVPSHESASFTRCGALGALRRPRPDRNLPV